MNMQFTNLVVFSKSSIIAIVAIILIIGGALFYIIKAKKGGIKCIGCPDSGKCKIKTIRKNLEEAKEYCCHYSKKEDE